MRKSQKSKEHSQWFIEDENFMKILPKKRGPKAKGSYRHEELFLIASHEVTKLIQPQTDNENHKWRFELKLEQENIRFPVGAVRKFIIYLHESFSPNKREFKKLPIHISELGYAPFQITVLIELSSRMIITNDDDCYKEPTRKYEKYLRQKFSYQLTFPVDGANHQSSSSILHIPFYTNNPKIIQEMKIYQASRVLHKFTETYKLDQIQHDFHSYSPYKLKSISSASHRRNPTKRSLADDEYIPAKKRSSSISLINNISQENSKFMNLANHPRFSSHPSFTTYLYDESDAIHKLHKDDIYENIGDNNNPLNFQSCHSNTNMSNDLSTCHADHLNYFHIKPQRVPTNSAITSQLTYSTGSNYADIKMIENSINDLSTSQSKKSIHNNRNFSPKDLIYKQGNYIVDSMNIHNSGLPSKVDMHFLSHIGSSNNSLCIHNNNNQHNLNSNVGDNLQPSPLTNTISIPNCSSNCSFNKYSISEAAVMYNSNNNLSKLCSTSNLEGSFSRVVSIPNLNYNNSAQMHPSRTQNLNALSISPTSISHHRGQSFVEKTPTIDNIMESQIKLLSLDMSNNLNAQRDIDHIGICSGTCNTNLLPTTIKNHIDQIKNENHSFEHFEFDHPQMNELVVNAGVNQCQRVLPSVSIADKIQPDFNILPFQNTNNSNNYANINQNYPLSGTSIISSHDSRNAVDLINSPFNHYTTYQSVAEEKFPSSHISQDDIKFRDGFFASIPKIINDPVHPSLQNCINSLRNQKNKIYQFQDYILSGNNNNSNFSQYHSPLNLTNISEQNLGFNFNYQPLQHESRVDLSQYRQTNHNRGYQNVLDDLSTKSEPTFDPQFENYHYRDEVRKNQ